MGEDERVLRRRPWAWVFLIAVALAVPAAGSGGGWRVSALPVPHTAFSYAEPTVAFGADGRGVITAATANAGVPPALWLTKDGGSTWAPPSSFDLSGAHTGDADAAVGADGWLYALNLAY